jgi:mono/diheme cytochrome c family protein
MINETNQDKKLVGVLGQFDTPGSLLHACDHARQSGVTKMDAYSPFPIHGIEQAIGIPRTKLPFIVLAIGLGACAAGLGLQWFTNATENWGPWSGYQFKISGKPYFSLPANIPVTFEIIVLSSAFAAFLGMLALNRLPHLANPLHRIARFKRATSDRFFLAIEAGEGGLQADVARHKLTDWGATDVEEIWMDQTDQQLPGFLKTVAVLGLVLMLLPPIMVFRGQGMTSRKTRLHFNPDMDFQVKFKAQTPGPIAPGPIADNPIVAQKYFFEHTRSSFAPVPGTVARDEDELDSEFLRGIKPGSDGHLTTVAAPLILASRQTAQDAPAAGQPPEPDWVTEFPPQFDVNEASMNLGRRKFNVYCSVCHGYAGEGNGLVNQRAVALSVNGSATWTTAKSLYDPAVVEQPVGRIFDTISNGRATMGPYGSRLAPTERWAIVLYIKALQETRAHAPAAAGPEAGDKAAPPAQPE